MIGSRFGHFRVIDRIGAGGMGEVYLARGRRAETPLTRPPQFDTLSDQPLLIVGEQ
jgi:hypothetical protein